MPQHDQQTPSHSKEGSEEPPIGKKSLSDVMQKLQRTTDPNNQLSILLNEFASMTNSSVNYQQICLDLRNSLQWKFPNVVVIPYGSYEIGTNFPQSILNIYVTGVRDAEHVMRRVDKFRFLTIEIKTPFRAIRCIHNDTGTTCLINTDHPLVISSTSLIKTYLNLDEKLMQMTMILKYWGGRHGISGNRFLISNYSLNLLILFYLQHRVLGCPSVWEIQKDIPWKSNWDGRFIEPPPRPPIERSLIDMLYDFFNFYANFDFETHVISPFLGVVVPKTDFSDDTLPREFEKYKLFKMREPKEIIRMTAMTIQDPFEHYRNVTHYVKEALLLKFTKYCELGRDLCAQVPNNLFVLLFTETPKAIVNGEADCNFSRFRVTRGNYDFLPLQKNERKEREAEWFEMFLNFFFTFMQSYLLITMEDVGDEQYTYKCTVTHDVWNKRHFAASKIQSKLSSLPTLDEKEKLITNFLLMVEENEGELPKLIFTLSLKHIIGKKTSWVKFRLDKIEAYQRQFTDFTNIFSDLLKLCYTKYEEEQKAVFRANMFS